MTIRRSISSSIPQQGNQCFSFQPQREDILPSTQESEAEEEGGYWEGTWSTVTKWRAQQGKEGKQAIWTEVGQGVSSRRWQKIEDSGTMQHEAEFSLPGKCVKMSADILSWKLQRDTEPEDSNSFLWQPKVQKHKHFHCHWQVLFT